MTRLFAACGLTLALLISGCANEESTGTNPAGTTGSSGSPETGSTDVALGAPSGSTATTGGTTTSGATSSGGGATTAAAGNVDLSFVTDKAAVAIVLRPNQALTNPLVKQVIAEVEAANPDFNLAKAIDEMQQQSGMNPNDIESVLVVLDEEHLEMLPFMAMMFMGGGMGGPPPGAFEEEMHIESEAFPQEFQEEIIIEEGAVPEAEFDSSLDDPTFPNEDAPESIPEETTTPGNGSSCDDEPATTTDAFADDQPVGNEFEIVGPEGAGEEFPVEGGEFGGPPFGEGPPPPTVVLQFKRDIDPKAIGTAGYGTTETVEYAGKTYFLKPDKTALWFPTNRTAIIAGEAKVKSLIDAQSQAGPLAATVGPLAGSEFALVLDVRPLHQFLSDMAQQNPGAAMAGGLVKQVNTLTLTADLTGANLMQLQLHTINEGSAGGMQAMLGGLVQQGQQAFTAQAEQGMAQLSPGQKAIMPLVQTLVAGATVTAQGNICTLTVPRPADLDKLPALLKPALAEMKEQADAQRRMDPLRNIVLAFHNCHDIYGFMPGNGGNGQPATPGGEPVRGAGLSWRVHILPFIEEYALYQEFNMEEPWDSEHNKALIARMPAIYGTNPEGKTSLHVFVGEGTPFGGESGPRMADIVDGTSNTILVVEAGPSTADVWTKPGGLELGDDPLAALGDIGETFLVGMMDGSVRSIPSTIDGETLKNVIQHADGNPVNIPE
jgi:hypothetical protein